MKTKNVSILCKKILEFSKQNSMNNDMAHDFNHILRVKCLALKISEEILCDKDLVIIVSLLHEIGDDKLTPPTKPLDTFLQSIGFEKSDIDTICFLVEHMSFSKFPYLPDDFMIEGKIVQDADRLDAIGSIGIARAIMYGCEKKTKLYNKNNLLDNSTILAHFCDKLLHLDRYLYTVKAKALAKNRAKITKQFYQELICEINFSLNHSDLN